MARKRKKGWECWNTSTGRYDYTSAWTKSEARAYFKRRFGVHPKMRLPIMNPVTRVQGD